MATTKRSLPESERIWKQIEWGGNHFFLTADPARLKYKLWKKVSGGYELMGSDATPDLLEDKFDAEIYGE